MFLSISARLTQNGLLSPGTTLAFWWGVVATTSGSYKRLNPYKQSCLCPVINDP